MIEITLSLWLGLSYPGTLPEVQVMPAGLYPAGVLIAVCQSLDGYPSVSSDPRLGSRPIWLIRPLLVTRDQLSTLDLLLRTAGVFRVSYRDRTGQVLTYVTPDPRRLPPEELPFRIRVLAVRHVDPMVAADTLNRAVRGRETNLPEGAYATRFVGDLRTSTLVIRYTSEEHLAHYLGLLARLDAPQPKEPGPVLRSYHCRFRWASDVVEELARRWKKEDRGEISIVSQRSTNRVLLRLPEPLWPEAKELLEEIDRPPRRH